MPADDGHTPHMRGIKNACRVRPTPHSFCFTFILRMDKEELIQLCHYYKGEDECPETFDEYDRGLWTAEKIVVTQFGATDVKQLVSLVLAFVGKWAPYTFEKYKKRYLLFFPELGDEMRRIYNS